MWMHNGMIGDFHLIKKKIINYLSDDIFNLIQGTTDSEYCFVLYLEVLFSMVGVKFQPTNDKIIPAATNQIQNCSPMVLKDAMIKTINLLNQWTRESKTTNSSMMNFCITDGRTVVASRYANFAHGPAASLFFSSGTKFQKNPSKPGSYMMAQADRRQMCHIISSEPVTVDTDDWVTVCRNITYFYCCFINILMF